MRKFTITDSVERYLACRHSLGYKMSSQGYMLRNFAAFVDSQTKVDRLDTQLALRWACLSSSAAPLYCARRLEVVRCFARYLAVFDERTEIPPMGILGAAHRRIKPHIYTDEEIETLLRSCSMLMPPDSLRPLTYRTLFGLLASTGLRVSEALRLANKDVDLSRAVLSVNETKFHKSRIIPIHSTVVAALAAYMSERDRRWAVPVSDRFFRSSKGAPLPYTTVRHAFRTLVRRLGWSSNGERKLPRIHDLRHSFASKRLRDWQRQGYDLMVMLPALSTYLGHVKVSDTYWYITALPDLLSDTAELFANFARPERGCRQ